MMSDSKTKTEKGSLQTMKWLAMCVLLPMTVRSFSTISPPLMVPRRSLSPSRSIPPAPPRHVTFSNVRDNDEEYGSYEDYEGDGSNDQTTESSSSSRPWSLERLASLPPFSFLNRKKRLREEEDTSLWMSWLASGRPRSHRGGVDAVVYREDPALGGLPRGDRYASRDWWHNAVNLPSSGVLRDVSSPMIAIGSWATAISVAHRWLLPQGVAAAMCVPVTCHSLSVSALGLLLVFRTNSAYQRFAEGRKIWEQISSTARSLSRMTKIYEKEITPEKRRRVQRLLAAFPYLLRHRIRPNLVMRRVSDTQYPRDAEHSLLLYADTAALDTDAEAGAIAESEEEMGEVRRRRRPRELHWVDKRTLPWRLLPPACARAQNRPLWVCDRLSRELTSVPNGPNFTNRERLMLLGMVNKLSNAIGACERIHQTVVPLNYARHSLRTLTVWLATLPFALVGQLGLLTGPALVVLSWMLFGVYEIGYSIEDPFQGTLRLSILCDQIRRDVLENEVIMGTAFQLDDEKTDDDEDEMEDDDEVETDGLNYERPIPVEQRSKTTPVNGERRSLHTGRKGRGVVPTSLPF